MARKNKKEEIKRPLSGKIVLAILVISIVWGIAIMSWILPVIGLVIFIGWWAVVTADPEEAYDNYQIKGFVPPPSYTDDPEFQKDLQRDLKEYEKYRDIYEDWKAYNRRNSRRRKISFEEFLEEHEIPRPKRDIDYLFN